MTIRKDIEDAVRLLTVRGVLVRVDAVRYALSEDFVEKYEDALEGIKREQPIDNARWMAVIVAMMDVMEIHSEEVAVNTDTLTILATIILNFMPLKQETTR